MIHEILSPSPLCLCSFVNSATSQPVPQPTQQECKTWRVSSFMAASLHGKKNIVHKNASPFRKSHKHKINHVKSLLFSSPQVRAVLCLLVLAVLHWSFQVCYSPVTLLESCHVKNEEGSEATGSLSEDVCRLKTFFNEWDGLERKGKPVSACRHSQLCHCGPHSCHTLLNNS